MEQIIKLNIYKADIEKLEEIIKTLKRYSEQIIHEKVTIKLNYLTTLKESNIKD